MNTGSLVSAVPWPRMSRITGGLRTALRAIARNRLRSALTALGIIIGVAAVIAMIAVGNGAQTSITGRISALGENLLTVFSGSSTTSGVAAGQGSANTLTVADLRALSREIPDIVATSPEVSASVQVAGDSRNWSTAVVGVSPEFLDIRDWALVEGRMFTDRELAAAARVAVIGSRTASELFGAASPVGRTIRVRDIPFVVIGALESKGAGFGGQNQDDRLLIPYTTQMKRVTGDRYLRSISLKIAGADRMGPAQEQIVALLRQRHRLADDAADDFSIFSQKDIAETVASVTDTIRLLLGSIASLSLIVGGIGIMNIMLVSVTERTREIGLRIALGAPPSAIRLQFLLEAVTLSLAGGACGVLLGVAASVLVGLTTSFQPEVGVDSVALAVSVSFVVGVVFGYLPARRAAQMDPIEALRHE